MKLEELMNLAFDEVWFCVVTSDGKEHYFLNSDYLGWHPDVMPELEPLLDREFDEFDLVIRKDPEKINVVNAQDVMMVWVRLLKTEEELDRYRKMAKRRQKRRKTSRKEHNGNYHSHAEV